MIITDYLVPFFIILIVCIGVQAIKQLPIEPFSATCQGLVTTMKDTDDVTKLYRDWGNGGISNNYNNGGISDQIVGPLTPYILPYDLPPESVRQPSNTLVDQLTCKDYAKRSCLGVTGNDRFDTCTTGQYNTCMDGRRRLIWPTSVESEGDDAYPLIDVPNYDA